MVEEKAPLISKPVNGAAPSKQSYAVNVSNESRNAEREWDGPLWKMCGNCDQAGLSTFAYVKMCTPFAFGYVSATSHSALLLGSPLTRLQPISYVLAHREGLCVVLRRRFACRHNLQRAFGKGFWLHAVIFTLLFCTWGYALMGTSSRVNEACGIHHPPGHLPGMSCTAVGFNRPLRYAQNLLDFDSICGTHLCV